MKQNAGIFTRLDTVIVRVRDLDAARAWYEKTLGFVAGYFDRQERLVIFNVGGTTSLTLWQLKPGERLPLAGTASTFPIFGTDDARQTHRLLGSRAVSVDPIQEGGGVRFFTFRDLDGNRLEVCELLGATSV